MPPLPSDVTDGCDRQRLVERRNRYAERRHSSVSALVPRALLTSVDFTQCRLYKILSWPHPRRIFKFAPIGYAGRETDF
jgi:hypothetical protein